MKKRNVLAKLIVLGFAVLFNWKKLNDSQKQLVHKWLNETFSLVENGK